ncbi:uncharacterized protein LOC127257559 [Andrographis paniculata]|uniref:uncharacterized protein LOC127257559 n=1 Tax=Andrographis paniculata TaxID=175694 RepID=UPI0021E81E71|nr:uncharacterized protein LOC127257559 [Andrographis paniculata]
MSRGDDEMMDAEGSAPPQTAGSSSGPDDVRSLLEKARRLIDQGRPSQALQAVIMAMQMQGGDESVVRRLSSAGENYRIRAQECAAADELASLFAECAIAEVNPQQPGFLQQKKDQNLALPDPDGNSILAETGRTQIMLDAFSDGSSFICLRCGGLVSNHRRDEHEKFWCCKI